jgi:2-dehydropantoate 2-reductase
VKIGVMGTGGIGGYYGALLARAGHEVFCVARGEHLRAIQEQGLRVESAVGEFTVRPRASADPAAIGLVDLVLFGVKTYDTGAAARAMKPMVGEGTAILTLQNGVDSAERIAAAVGPGRVLPGAAFIFANIAGPGLIRQTAGPRKIVFGEVEGARSPRAEAILAALRGAEINAEVTDQIVRVLWEKWAYICAQGGVTAVTRLPLGEIRACQETWLLYRGIIEEIAAVAAARRVSLSPGVVETILAQAAKLEPHARSSMYNDLAAGRRLEVEALNGTVVRYGREAGVPTPLNMAIYAALAPHAVGKS